MECSDMMAKGFLAKLRSIQEDGLAPDMLPPKHQPAFLNTVQLFSTPAQL